MIGAAALLIGLLLLMAGLLGARIPGGATFALPGIARSGGTHEPAAGGLFGLGRPGFDPVRALILAPIHPATWHANAAIALGLFIGTIGFAIVAAIASLAASTLVFGVGILFFALAMEGARLIARMERWRASIGDPEPRRAHLYRPLRGGPLDLLRAEFADASRWRDALYLVVNLPLVMIEFTVVGLLWVFALALVTMPIWFDAIPSATLPDVFEPVGGRDAAIVVARTALGLLLLALAGSASQLVMALHRGLVTGLLCTSESRELRRQLAEVRASRSAVLDTEASELHRIERDLHDGAQQRLVMLSIDLGLASERVETDPAAARELILQGQEQARQALAEIRDLVRGIAPAILLDRGLRAAVDSISGRGPVSTAVTGNVDPGDRFPQSVERAAYFVVAEALANVAKHSRASRCEVRLNRSWSRLTVEVNDDGAGGASIGAGGGLAGLANRITAVDGTFTVSSPPGGPTLVQATIPLAADQG